MENKKIKIVLSTSDGSYVKDIDTKSVEGLSNIRFSSNLGSGQGEVGLLIRENYDSQDYQEGQIVEIAFYDSEHVNGALQYAGFVKNINRTYSQENGDSVELEILGLCSLLGERPGSFSFSGTLAAAVSAFVNQFHAEYDFSQALEFVGAHVFKNGVVATTAVSVSLSGTYFEMLKALFDSVGKTFFVKREGTIVLGDQSTEEHLLAINKDVIDLKIASSRQTEIILVGNSYEIEPGDKIFINNVNQNFNLDGSRVEKAEYRLTETRLYLGNVWSLGTDILRN